jgi:hypothetical protein
MSIVKAWGAADRENLRTWLGVNAYRMAFLVHTCPTTQNTLERISRGYHDPGALLGARLRDLLEKYPRGQGLPHDPGLLSD